MIKRERIPVTNLSFCTKDTTLSIKDTTLSIKILETNRHNLQQPGGLKQHKTGGGRESRKRRRETRAAERIPAFSATDSDETDSVSITSGATKAVSEPSEQMDEVSGTSVETDTESKVSSGYSSGQVNGKDETNIFIKREQREKMNFAIPIHK